MCAETGCGWWVVGVSEGVCLGLLPAAPSVPLLPPSSSPFSWPGLGGACGRDRPLGLAETYLGPPLSLGRGREHLGQAVLLSTGPSIHFIPSNQGFWAQRSPHPPPAKCRPEVLAWSWSGRVPTSPATTGSAFPCTTSAEWLRTQQLESWAGQYCQQGVGGRYQNLAAVPETKTRPRWGGGRAQGSQAGASQREPDPY